MSGAGSCPKSPPLSPGSPNHANAQLVHIYGDQRLGIIGGGEMAKSIVFPLFEMGILDPFKVIVSGTSLVRLEPWANYGCKTTISNAQIVETAHIIMWAVKPQMFQKVVQTTFDELGSRCIQRNLLHISVLAGTTLNELCQNFKYLDGLGQRVARVMPNIGLRVKAGCAVYAMNPSSAAGDDVLVSNLFSSTGLCFAVQEAQINALTAVFGCGIGFMFPVIEAMSDGAVKMGIPRDMSLQLVAQTMKGAAELILQEKKHPGILKDSVCSAGGSTIAGIAELEKGGIRSSFISAVEASTKRGFELGQLNQPVKKE